MIRMMSLSWLPPVVLECRNAKREASGAQVGLVSTPSLGNVSWRRSDPSPRMTHRLPPLTVTAKRPGKAKAGSAEVDAIEADIGGWAGVPEGAGEQAAATVKTITERKADLPGSTRRTTAVPSR